MGTLRSVEELKGAVDSLAVYGEYVRLKVKGTRAMGLCPFHREKTPSFSVNGESGLFYCFGCHKGGDLIQFIEEMESCGFREAVEILARKGGLSFEFEKRGSGQEIKRDKRDRLHSLVEAAAVYFRQCFNRSADASAVKRYCESRGITGEVRERLKLGFAPSSGGLLPFIVSNGFTAEECVEAGLVKDTGRGDYRERFFNRLIFPIGDTMGRTVGFGGRVIGEGEPKYLNSPESPIFHKRSLLYGLDITRKAVKDQGRIVVVEGYMDFLAAFQAGVENVSATLGTALADGQVTLMKRYAGEAILNFDSDAAGMDAARRAIKLLLAGDMSVRIAVVPAGKDPDDLIRQKGPEAYMDMLENAPSFFDFLLENNREEFELDTASGKRAYIDSFTEYLQAVADPIERQEYAKELASRTGVELSLIMKRMKSESGRERVEEKKAIPPEIPAREQLILMGAMAFPEEARRLVAKVPEEAVSRMETANLLRNLLADGDISDPEQKRVMAMVENGCHTVPSEDDFAAAIGDLFAAHLRDRDREIQRRIQDASSRKDFEMVKILSREKLSLLTELKSLEQSGLL